MQGIMGSVRTREHAPLFGSQIPFCHSSFPLHFAHHLWKHPKTTSVQFRSQTNRTAVQSGKSTLEVSLDDCLQWRWCNRNGGALPLFQFLIYFKLWHCALWHHYVFAHCSYNYNEHKLLQRCILHLDAMSSWLLMIISSVVVNKPLSCREVLPCFLLLCDRLIHCPLTSFLMTLCKRTRTQGSYSLLICPVSAISF